MNAANWHEAGIDARTTWQWWGNHKVQDAARKEYESAKKRASDRRAALQKSAMSKLTADERSVLGLK